MRLHYLFTTFLMTLWTLPVTVSCAEILQTSSFSNCDENASNITVQKVNVKYDNDAKTVTYSLAGTSAESMNVTAALDVLAYGISVYSNSFNPCDTSTYVRQLCPVPEGAFSADGSQVVPAQYADVVPAAAFKVPDISAQATLKLKSLDTGATVACITSVVTNGKTASIPAVSYVAASIAGTALLVTGSASIAGVLSGGAHGVGSGTASPGFITVMGWFQGLAMNGMMSVSYPPVYRAFTKNFAFSTGLIPWTAMQTGIDNFRSMTGGNLTDDNVQFLQNATLTFGDGTTSTNSSSIQRRSLEIFQRRGIVSNDNSSTSTSSDSTLSEIQVKVSGISAYVEELSVPQGNSFMTVLLIIAIVIAAVAFAILFVKLVLEVWALIGTLPKTLTRFRRGYWGILARTIVQLVLLAYGTLVLFCIYQLANGDSWAAKLLAAVVLTVFTGLLAFFSFRIWQLARNSKRTDGDVSQLYDDKETWIKYSLFYESYKKDFWWTFIPAIVYMFAKGCVLAAADGHGMVQTIAQLVVETVVLLLVLFTRPYERKSGNVINIFIQVVRALSVVLILVFVEELGIAQTTQTVMGVVLIVIQSVLTTLLAILIFVNAIISLAKANPHRKRRKEAEKLNRDLDNLTPLYAHNSLLMSGSNSSKLNNMYDQSMGTFATTTKSPTVYVNESPKLPLLPIAAENKQIGVGAGRDSHSGLHPSTTASPAPIGAPYTSANSYSNVMREGADNKAYDPRGEESVESLVLHAAPPALGGSRLGREADHSSVGGYRGWQ